MRSGMKVTDIGQIHYAARRSDYATLDSDACVVMPATAVSSGSFDGLRKSPAGREGRVLRFRRRG